MIHPLADVQTDKIGENTTILQYVIILSGAVIGKNCTVNCHTFIENDVIVGDNVIINSGTHLWDALRIEDDVFLGSNVVFATDVTPRSKKRVDYPITTVKRGASLGSNTTVIPGITIGRYAMTGAGSVVTKDIPDYSLVYGNPAVHQAWIDENGRDLIPRSGGEWISQDGSHFREEGMKIIKIQPHLLPEDDA